MLMDYLAVIAVIIFAILVFFIVRTLLTVNRTLQHVDFTMVKLEMRMKSIDPLLKSVSNLGDIAEDKTSHLKEECCRRASLCEEKQYYKRQSQDEIKGELAEWVLLSANLATKFFKRRGI